MWIKVGSQRLPFTATVTNTSSNINEIVSVLTISEAIGYYSGQYFCEAKNSAGTTTSSPASLNVNGMYVYLQQVHTNFAHYSYIHLCNMLLLVLINN